MAWNNDDQSLIRKYLLNQLTGEQQQQFEQRLLTDDGVFEELEIAEDELIDEFLSEKLSEDERVRFEQYFLAMPERQQKVRFSRTLSRYVRANEKLDDASALSGPHFGTTNNWALPIAAAVAVIVIVAGIFWFSRPRNPSAPTLATFTLTLSTQTRGEGPPATKARVPLNADVRLRLVLPEPANPAMRYRVESLTPSGDTQTLPKVGQDGHSVIVDIPGGQLSRGEYALNVYAIQPDDTEERLRGSYLFTVD